jgi:tetratricopeptide (TPR) repeat protein
LSQDASLLKNKQVLFNYGASLNGIKDWPNAEIVWTNYLKLDKNSKEGWLNLASAEAAQKKYSEAINSYQMALNYGASKLETLTQISNLQVQNKDYEGAEASYKELVSLKPDSVKYRLTLSRILAKAGKNDESLKLLKESSQTFPSLRLELAEKLVASGDYYSAATEYQKVLTDESNNFDAVMGLADSYAAIGQFSEAAKLYKRYLGKYADNFHAQYNYALALANTGKEAESVAEYKRAIDINPYNPDSYYALGAVLIDKDATQARDNWKRYLELQPQGEFRREILHQFPDLKTD